MRSGQRFLFLSSLGASAALLLNACSGGGSGGSQFSITAVNVTDGTIWRINRPIKITFSEPVDFDSVTLNSFNVRRAGGGPAAGEFYTEDGGRTVVFQPLCPVRDDLSDAGLLAGTDPLNNDEPYAYELNVIGADVNSQIPIRSASGDALRLSQTRNFTTPVSTNALNLYLDTKVGPPTANVRRVNNAGCEILQNVAPADACNPPPGSVLSQENVYARYNPTYIESIDPVTRQAVKHVFTLNVETNELTLEPPLTLPLNRLGDPLSRVSLIVGINQAVDPSVANIDPSRVRWEFTADASAPSPTWVPLSTTVELESNCAIIGLDDDGNTVAVPGARVRVTPNGALPPSSDLRAILAAEFADIVGETNPIQVAHFAEASTEEFPTNPAILQDQYLEDFDTSANDDATASFAEPHAEWGDGECGARFSYTGTGGPGGGFDWYIRSGDLVVFNTANSTINGYQLTFLTGSDVVDQDIPIGTQTVVGGIVDVNDFVIEPSATLKIEGPNPFLMMASGRVVIGGQIIVSGTSSNGVNTLNTTNIPEPGATGQAGGGRGGTGSPLTTASSPKGGNGFGAFNVADGGGVGGETGWSLLSAENRRRGAGGGGGTLGPNQFFQFPLNPAPGALFEQRRIGFDGENGFENVSGDNGAINGINGPLGGAVGPSPFTDPNPSNNFFGTMFMASTATPVLGELAEPWAGAGGGGGGDASRLTSGTFPGPWNPFGDEKGAGGGGGGGSFHIMALGRISFGASGQIASRGGLGGGGENTIFLNRVGGGSGGGSGGHVVLQSSSTIDFSAKNTTTTYVNLDLAGTPTNQNTWAIDCRGGQGGAGSGDIGGAVQSTQGQKETLPLQDACPSGYPTTGTNACRGLIDGAGGDGSPGIIQLHTSAGTVGTSAAAGADIILGTGVDITWLCAPPPLCRNNTVSVPTCHMIPTFGRLSRARSKWIALGEGGFDANTSTYRNVTFSFGGINPATGLVLTNGLGVVNPHDVAVNSTSVIALGPGDDPNVAVPPFVTNDGYHLVLLDTQFQAGYEPFITAPSLLEHFLVVLSGGSSDARFDVISATYDAGTGRVTLTTDGDGPSMLGYGIGVGTDVALERAYFRVASSGVNDSLPATATVKIQFEATGVDPVLGGPNLSTIIGPTSNMSVLNTLPNGHLRFVRFNVLFDISALGGQLSPANPIPELQFLRLPFAY